MNQHDLMDQTIEPANGRGEELTSELLILPDGRILVHNLTGPFADLLGALNPDDPQIQPRAPSRVTP